jgi:hypothetical protein
MGIPNDSHNSSCCHGLHFLIFSSDVRDSSVATFCFWIICDYLEIPNPEEFLGLLVFTWLHLKSMDFDCEQNVKLLKLLTLGVLLQGLSQFQIPKRWRANIFRVSRFRDDHAW